MFIGKVAATKTHILHLYLLFIKLYLHIYLLLSLNKLLQSSTTTPI